VCRKSPTTHFLPSAIFFARPIVSPKPPTTSPVRVIAGIADDRQTIRIFISNPSNEAQALRFDLIGLPSDGPMEYRERLIDSQSDFVPVGGSVKIRDSTLEQNIGPHSVILLTISPQQNPG